MSNRFLARAIVAGLLVVAGMNLGCGESPSGPSPLAAQPVTPLEALTVTRVSPSSGFTDFACEIRVAGTGFLPGATLTMAGVAATVTAVTSTEITATTPLHERGTVDVVVTNPGGQSATLTMGYAFGVVSLTATPSTVPAGAQLTLSWEAPSGRSDSDWIGLFKIGDASTNYENGWWQYTHGAASGTLMLSAPTRSGEYEFRYLLDDGYFDVARSVPVTVSASASS